MDDDFIIIATAFLESVARELDPYTSQKSQITTLSETQVAMVTPYYIQFAKYGRGPGKQPPLDPILEWVRNKRFQFRNDRGRFISYEGTAWAIAKSISKKGTKNWVPNAPNAIDEAIAAHIDNYINELNLDIMFKQTEKLNEVYAQVFPKEIQIKL